MTADRSAEPGALRCIVTELCHESLEQKLYKGEGKPLPLEYILQVMMCNTELLMYRTQSIIPF